MHAAHFKLLRWIHLHFPQLRFFEIGMSHPGRPFGHLDLVDVTDRPLKPRKLNDDTSSVRGLLARHGAPQWYRPMDVLAPGAPNSGTKHVRVFDENLQCLLILSVNTKRT
jgi:hypothetical protein